MNIREMVGKKGWMVAVVVGLLLGNEGMLRAQSGDLILDPDGPEGYFSLVVTGGLIARNHTGQFTLTEEDIVCCQFDGGTGTGPSLALRGEYALDQAGRLRAGLRIGMTSGSASFLSDPEVLPVLGADHRPQDGTFQNELTIGTTWLDVAPFGMVKLIDADLYLTLGPSWSTRLSTSTDLQERIVAPQGLTYLDGTTTKERQNLPVVLVADDRFAVVGGLDFRYPVAERLRIAAELLYEHPLSAFGASEEWKASGVSAGVGVEIGL